MNTKDDRFFDKSVESIPSFADKCRDMEKTLNTKLLSTNLEQTNDAYTVRLVKAIQSLHDLNKHH